jgi:hypothetical protein
VAEVGARLGISAERVRQLAKSGEMPDPVGRLGRQLVWQWIDVEVWAIGQGRFPLSADKSQHSQRTEPKGTSGGSRLVVDEVMEFGRKNRNACHVRVWAPTSGSTGAHVVLLGHLNEFRGTGLTNDIESAAMTAARRYLGRSWRRAQFFQYTPAGGLFESGEFSRVTFTIRERRPRSRKRTRGRVESDLIDVMGGELCDPVWRPTNVDEIAELTGDLPRTWMPGVYTSELIKATAELPPGWPETTWDPANARSLSHLASTLEMVRSTSSRMGSAEEFGLPIELSSIELELAVSVVAHATLDALEQAQQDVRTQPADTAIWLRAPELRNEAELFAIAECSLLTSLDPVDGWQLVTNLRSQIVAATSQDCTIRAQQQLLVPGVRGGWVELAWYEANVAEPLPLNEGWLGPTASSSDLIVSPEQEASKAPAPEPFDQLVLLIETLVDYLREEWDLWATYDVPSLRPSEPLSATGPLSRAYLDAVNWLEPDDLDNYRLRRLEGVFEPGRCGLDPDGNLVSVTKDGKEFACEWPVSGPPDDTLAHATIRADRPSRGPTPVFVARSDGRLQLLPSAPDFLHGNSFTWGYPGTGPSNLAAAVIDLLRRSADSIEIDAAEEFVHDLAVSAHVPNWPVADLLKSVEPAAGLIDVSQPGPK